MKKEALIKLAGDKNFTSKFIYSRPYKYLCCEKKEKTRFVLWMAELQEWLRDNYKTHIVIISTSQEKWKYHIVKHDQKLDESFSEGFFNYEEALNDGLLESLKTL
jgi:hypothetical protein